MNYCNCPNCRTENCPNAVEEPAFCIWTEKGEGEYWEGECGAAWCFNEAGGGPSRNNMRHCPECGRLVKENAEVSDSRRVVLSPKKWTYEYQ